MKCIKCNSEKLEINTYIKKLEENKYERIVTKVCLVCGYKTKEIDFLTFDEVFSGGTEKALTTEEYIEELEQENEKLKQQVEDLENNQETVLTTLELATNQIEKLKKAIEILKVHLHVKELDIDYVLDFNGLYGDHLTKQEYELLKEVLGE